MIQVHINQLSSSWNKNVREHADDEFKYNFFDEK